VIEPVLCLSAFACAVTLLATIASVSARGLCVDSPLIDWRFAPFALLAAAASMSVARDGMMESLPVSVALAACAVCAASDIRTGLVFDNVSFPAGAGAIVCSLLCGRGVSSVFGAMCGAAALLTLWAVTRGRGMGLGDVKLAAVAGAATGPVSILMALGCAFVCGAVVSVTMLAARRATRKQAIRFAPYIALGASAVTMMRGWL
jgi:leader peptidase (prepilin peptidase)/N-methyltransferase